jgi:hemerythrin
MPLMKWDPSLSVGDAKLDGQHQELVNILNKLFDAMKEGHGREVQQDVLNSLVSYTQKHFQDEERAMQRAGFPELEAHKREHAQLIEEVGGFLKAFNSGKNFQHIQMMTFLKSWLLDHIKGSDKAYAPYLSKTAV